MKKVNRFFVFLIVLLSLACTNVVDASDDESIRIDILPEKQVDINIIKSSEVTPVNKEYAVSLVNYASDSDNSFSISTASQQTEVSNGTYFLFIENNAGTEEILLKNNNRGFEAGDSVIVPLYCRSPMYDCLLEDQFYLDIPWRIEPKKNIPVFGIINTPSKIKNVRIYDTKHTPNTFDDFLLDQKIFYPSLNISASKIPYTFIFSVNASNTSIENRTASIRIAFGVDDTIEYDNDEGPLETFISSDNIPKLSNWYFGDTHFHSEYTSNAVEFGAPTETIKNASKTIGLDWITITDHSFGINPLKWPDSINDCNTISDSEFKCIHGEEISAYTGDSPSCVPIPPLYNHYLAYGITQYIDGGECFNFDSSHSTYSPQEVISEVNAQGGFGYVAHPMHPDVFRDVWQNYSLPFTGLEIWNGENAIAELELGLIQWRALLLSGRKVFVEAGSDAHGDFNSALGKVRTVCFARNFTKDNIFTALKSGNCMMTDGPLVVFTANRHIIGESFYVSEGDTILLNVSWNSTNEFGNVTEIFLIRGEIQGTEINETIKTPNNLSGNIVITSAPNNTYYRIEARSIDSEGTIRRAYTNPIWVYAEPRPEVEKIPMDESELALVARFENKYEYSLKNLFFDAEQSLICDKNSLRENLNLNSSWQVVKCEKMFLSNARFMWAGFNNTETNEKRIVLQIGNILQFTNASYNYLTQNWKGVWPGGGTYQNKNWIAYKYEKEVFEINEITNTNSCSRGVCPYYFGTYLIYGFKKYEGNTTAYYTHWGYSQILTNGIRSIFFTFDNKTSIHLADSYTPNTEGVFGKKTFAYNASSFGFGASGAYIYMGSMGGIDYVEGSAFDPINRSVFSVSQTDSKILCHSDTDCNDGSLLTKDTCTNAGTTESKCEHTPQEPEEIKKPFTEMDVDEVSKAIDFKTKHNKTLSELYFDGWKNTTCNNDGILETLKLDKNWSVIQCRKFLINGTLAMFAGLNKTAGGEMYVAYQLGSALVDEIANHKYISETYQYPKLVNTITYYLDIWEGVKNNTKRFEIDFFRTKGCDGFGGCSDITIYGTYIIHGFRADANKNASVLYSYSKPINADLFKILFDNYRNFSIDDFSSSGNIYETKTFNYLPLHGWALGTFGFNYPLYNRSIFEPYRANELIVGLESPAHLLARDSGGRITGYFNGTYLTEIPNSEIIINTTHEKYRLPANESYRFFVEGYECGNYSLKITRASGENSSIVYFRNISATNETRDIFELNETASIGVKTNDSEKNIIVILDGIVGSSESLEFTAAKNKSVSIYVSNWSALNESTTITENINYPPEIISKYPENGSVFGLFESIAIVLNAADKNNDSLEYLILFDSAELAREKEINYALSNAGSHTINFSVSDGLNTVSEEISIYVIAPPAVTIISPENTTYNSSIILINALFGETVNTAWVVRDNASAQNYTNNVSSISIYLNDLADGAHKIRAYANNSVGMENHSEIVFTISTTQPVIVPPPHNGGSGGGNKPENKTKKDKDEKNKENKKPKQEKNEKDDFKDTKNIRKNITEPDSGLSDEKDEAPKYENYNSRYTGRFVNLISEKMQKLVVLLLGLFGL